MAGASTLRFERDGAIARLTLDRPQSGNAITLDLARELADAARRCAEDAGIRCVLLSGSGRLFCSGGDLSAFAAAGDAAPQRLRELATTLHGALLTLARMRKPLVTAINGPAAGAGLSLAIIGDVVLAARSAHFTAAYGSVGLSPDGGMSWWLPRLVGLRRAQDLIISNRRIAADEAAAIGLVSRVVDDAMLAAQADDCATTLSRAATGAIGAARTLLLDGASRSFAEQLDAEVEAIVRAGSSAEHREGLAAVLARRAPDFPAPL